MRTSAVVMVFVAAILVTGVVSAGAPELIEGPAEARTRGIEDIRKFLDQCPTSDPALSSILLDFQIRRDRQPVAIPFCSEPVSRMAVAEYTDVLLVLQGLRVMYYMDRGMSGHLPWTTLPLYDWVRSKIGGINIRSSGGASCCDTIEGRVYINVAAQDAFNREFDKKWIGIAGNIDLYAHEARHIDGFPHVSCCGIANGCDAAFDPRNLSPYGLQWWLNSLWLDGTINVGVGCLSAAERNEAANWFRGASDQFRNRFCESKPAAVTTPPRPGGPCALGTRRRAARS